MPYGYHQKCYYAAIHSETCIPSLQMNSYDRSLSGGMEYKRKNRFHINIVKNIETDFFFNELKVFEIGRLFYFIFLLTILLNIKVLKNTENVLFFNLCIFQPRKTIHFSLYNISCQKPLYK